MQANSKINNSNRLIILLAILGVVIYGAVIYISGYYQDLDRAKKAGSALAALDELRRSFVLYKEQELILLQSGDIGKATDGIQSSINQERQDLTKYIKLSDYNQELNSMAPKIWLSFEAWSSLALEMARQTTAAGIAPEAGAGNPLQPLYERSLSSYLNVMELLGDSDKVLKSEVNRGEHASGQLLIFTLVLAAYIIILAFWYMWSVLTREKRQYKNVRELREMSNKDALTGLTNRIVLEDRCTTAIAGARRFGSFVGVLYIDIDGLEELNVQKGYQSGDLVLKEAALRLQKHTREMDTVARIGEDEFSVLAANLKNKEDIRVVANKIRDVLTRPIELGKEEYTLGVSIGYSVFPDDGEMAEQLVNKANSSMYKAKGSAHEPKASTQH